MPDRPALDAGQRAQQARPPPVGPGQHGLRVGDGGEHLAHVVARAGAGGDDVGELGGVARRRHGLRRRRRERGVRGQVGQERAEGVERVGLGVDDEVGVAGGRRGLGPAELVVGDALADRGLDHRRPGQRHGRPAGHDDVVGGGGVQRRVAVGRAEDRRRPRHRGAAVGGAEEAGEVEREAGEPPAHDVGHPSAVGVAEQHEREAAALGVLDEPALLAHADRRRGAGDGGGVDPDDADPAPVERAEPGDHGVAGHGLLAADLRLGERADLEPACRGRRARSTRSRTGIRPEARCRASACSPPIASAASRRRASSSSASVMPDRAVSGAVASCAGGLCAGVWPGGTGPWPLATGTVPPRVTWLSRRP